MEKLSNIKLNLTVNDSLPEPEFNCDTCQDRDWVIVNGLAKRCECFKNRIHKIIEKKIGKHHIEKYNDFQEKFTKAMSDSGKPSCWMYSGTGKGKTALLSHWIKRRNQNMLLVAGVDLVELFQSQNDEGQYIKLKTDFSQYKMIVVDDIDKNWPFTPSVKTMIYKFIDDIVRNDKQQLLVTSNTSLTEFCSIWPDHQKEPLLRRLNEKCFT